MTTEHIDHADELDRYAHEAKEGRSGTMRDAPDSLTLKAAAKELRMLRDILKTAVDAYSYFDDSEPGYPKYWITWPGGYKACRLTREECVDEFAHAIGLGRNESARAAVRKACGIEEEATG
jgi:hypothetical protein